MELTLADIFDYFTETEGCEELSIDFCNNAINHGFHKNVPDGLRECVLCYAEGEPGDECFFWYNKTLEFLGLPKINQED